MQPFTQIRAGPLAQIEEGVFDFGTWVKREGPKSSDRCTKHTGTESQCGGRVVFTRGWVGLSHGVPIAEIEPALRN